MTEQTEQTYSTVSALQAAIKQNPLDPVTRLIYADALEDSGNSEESSRQRSLAGRLAHPLTDHQIKELREALDRANGKRRKRTLKLEDCLYCAKRALLSRDGWSWIAGGTVPLAYGYPSYQTICVAAVRSNGTVRIGVAETSAGRGASPTVPVCGLARNASPEMFRAWADGNRDEAVTRTHIIKIGEVRESP